MRPFRPLVHLLALIFALAQGLVPAAAAVGDGVLVAAAQRAGGAGHVEERGGTDCPRVHTDACELCRLLSMRGAPTTVEGAAVAPTARARVAATPYDPGTAAARATCALPRGPPAA